MLLKDGTLIPKHVGDMSLVLTHMWYDAIGWCNKLPTLITVLNVAYSGCTENGLSSSSLITVFSAILIGLKIL